MKIKVWVAALENQDGTALNAAVSRDDLIAQIAAYCRNSWDELVKGAESVGGKSDKDLIDYYFSHRGALSREWLTMEEIEIDIAKDDAA